RSVHLMDSSPIHPLAGVWGGFFSPHPCLPARAGFGAEPQGFPVPLLLTVAPAAREHRKARMCRSARRANAGVDSTCRIRREVSSGGGRKLRSYFSGVVPCPVIRQQFSW